MYIEINRGPSSRNCPLKASRQKKKWSTSQSLNYDVAINAQLLQTKDPVLKFYDDCFASRSSEEASRSISNLFYSSF